MNKKIKYSIFLICLLGTLFFIQLNILTNFSLGIENDIDYIFSNDNLYNSTNINYSEQWNTRNQTILIPADLNATTYSFTGETGINLTDIDFIDTNEGTGFFEVINNLSGHDEIIVCYITTGGQDALFSHNTEDQTSGTYEFWVQSNDTAMTANFKARHGGTEAIDVLIYQNFIRTYIGASPTNIKSATDNIWYHIRIDFECAGGSYMGLSADTFFIYINGQKYGAYGFDNTVDHIDNLYFGGNINSNNNNAYYDAFGFSWDNNYTLNDNLLPTYSNTSISEVDKWEFALQSKDVMNPIGTDNPNGWNDIEDGGGDIVNINSDSTNDRIIYMYAQAYDIGIEKDDFIITNSQYLNISWSFLYYDSTAVLVCLQSMKIYSNDSTLIADINIYLDNSPFEQKLQYYNSSSYIDLPIQDLWLSGHTWLDFNLFIDYKLDIAILRVFNSSQWLDLYIFPLIAQNKIGLDKIIFKQTDNSAVQHAPIKLDSIGVYADGISICDEWNWQSIELPSNWNLKHHNLFNFSGSGSGNISVSDGSYEVGISDFVDLFDLFYTYYTYPKTFNLYDKYIANINNPYLISYQVNYIDDIYIGWFRTGNLYIENISINGVLLIENEKEYNLEYSYSTDYTNPESNYFYIPENSTKMYFTLTCANSHLEYIQAEFNINDEMSDDTLIQLDSDIWGTPFLFGVGILETHFSDSTYLEFDFSVGIGTNFIAPLNKRFSNLTVLITDNDIDAASGSTIEGWIENITFKYYYNAGISLLMEDLMGMLIPLIVILVPAFLLNAVLNRSQKEGKEYNILVPMLLLMTIVAIATDLIPIWVSFSIIFSLIVYLILHKEQKDTGDENI